VALRLLELGKRELEHTVLNLRLDPASPIRVERGRASAPGEKLAVVLW